MLWDEWYEQLEKLDPDDEQWSKADAFIERLHTLLEDRKKRLRATLEDALRSLCASGAEELAYFEMEDIIGWSVDLFPKDSIADSVDDIASLRPIAIAQIDHDACLLAQGILCDTCATRCPTHIKAIRMNGRHPVLDATRCTGCGLCAYHCEAEPGAIKLN